MQDLIILVLVCLFVYKSNVYKNINENELILNLASNI